MINIHKQYTGRQGPGAGWHTEQRMDGWGAEPRTEAGRRNRHTLMDETDIPSGTSAGMEFPGTYHTSPPQK